VTNTLFYLAQFEWEGSELIEKKEPPLVFDDIEEIPF
jgi:hypothetical protein